MWIHWIYDTGNTVFCNRTRRNILSFSYFHMTMYPSNISFFPFVVTNFTLFKDLTNFHIQFFHFVIIHMNESPEHVSCFSIRSNYRFKRLEINDIRRIQYSHYLTTTRCIYFFVFFFISTKIQRFFTFMGKAKSTNSINRISISL